MSNRMSVLSRRLGRFAGGFSFATVAFFSIGLYAAANTKGQVVFLFAGLVLVCLFASFFLWLAHGFAWAMIPEKPADAKKPAEELKKMGGAMAIIATAPSAKAMSELIDGIAPNGRLMVVGADFGTIEVTPVQLIVGVREIHGWAAGIPAEAEDTLRFAELTGVRPMIETYPLEKAAEAYDRMMSGHAQFRVVLTM